MSNPRFRSNKGLVAAAVVAAAFAGAAVTWFVLAPQASRTPAEKSAPAARKILYYRNPMGGSDISYTPKKDSMGMDYVPVYADEGGVSEPGVVRIDPVIIQDMGVRTAVVRRGDVGGEVQANGAVVPDEGRVTTVTLKTDGYIERLNARKTGQLIRRGELLFTLYSPDLTALFREYLGALRYVHSLKPSDSAYRDARALADATRERLRLLGVDAREIARAGATQQAPRAIAFYAPYTGVVLKKNLLEGAYVQAGAELLTLADLSRVWVLADVYAQDLHAVHVGDPARITLQGLPGRVFRGRVDFLYPTLSDTARAVKARIVLPNPNGALRPDMYAAVTIDNPTRTSHLLVPASAVLRDAGGASVVLALGGGRFKPQRIQLGAPVGQDYVVRSGLDEGQRVVTSAQFLIDSAANLSEALQKMTPPAPEKAQ